MPFKKTSEMSDSEVCQKFEAWQASHEVNNPRLPGYERFQELDAEMSQRGLVKRILSLVVPGRGRHNGGSES